MDDDSAIELDSDLLHFITCGSVDDGKSTLIGRLLYDSRLIWEDQLSRLIQDSNRAGNADSEIDFALLVDGLEAEREQRITIDVAYRYFKTTRRSFIVADTPGHEQYTRNMATGASKATVAVLLVDARKGLLVQTRRHSLICSLFGLRHIILAINKMDLLSYREETYARITAEYRQFAAPLGFKSIVAIPVSALRGDNVTERSARMPWYSGATLLAYLESVDVASELAKQPFRFPVQSVNRPHMDFRGHAGTIASGTIRSGDLILAPSGHTAKIKEIITYEGALPFAMCGQAVTLTIDRDLDIGRGDLLASPDAPPEVSDQFAADLIWMSEKALFPRRSYLARIGTKTISATVTAIKYRIDVDTGAKATAQSLGLNDIGLCHIATSSPVAFDLYQKNRATGCFILIDRISNATVGAGMISANLRAGTKVQWQESFIGKSQRAEQKHQRQTILWFTGFSGAGKSTIANLVEQKLYKAGYHTILLDGDNVRQGLNRDLGFTEADRIENIRRVGEVAKLMIEAGLVVICSFISPYTAEREMVRNLVEEGEFIEIFVDTPLAECMRRDPKGLYASAKAGKLANLTGVDAPYEAPLRPEIRVQTMEQSAEELAASVLDYLATRTMIDHIAN